MIDSILAVAVALSLLGTLVLVFEIKNSRKYKHLRRQVKRELEEHRKYEAERVEVRRRPGWHPDQRVEVVVQRVQRALHQAGKKADPEEIRKLVREALR